MLPDGSLSRLISSLVHRGKVDATDDHPFATFGHDTPVDSLSSGNTKATNSAFQIVLEGRIRDARWEGFEPPAA
jgi:hypothetical protein